MKLTKQILKRIIKEELNAVMNEVSIKPAPPGGNVTADQMGKIDDLIYSGKPEFITQARELLSALGGRPDYVDDILVYMTDRIVPLAHSHEDVADSFPDLENATPQDHRDFYNATVGQEYEIRKAIDDNYSSTPLQRKTAQEKYIDASNARRVARREGR